MDYTNVVVAGIFTIGLVFLAGSILGAVVGGAEDNSSVNGVLIVVILFMGIGLFISSIVATNTANKQYYSSLIPDFDQQVIEEEYAIAQKELLDKVNKDE